MNEIELLKKYLLTDDIEKYKNEIFEIIPELKYTDGFDQKSSWHTYDVWHHIVFAVNNCDMNFEDRLTLLLHDIGKPFSYQDDGDIRHFHNHAEISGQMAYEILKRIKVDDEVINNIVMLIINHASKINLEKVNIQNVNYYLRLLKIQKCDGYAYEKEHAYIILKKLLVQEDYINNIVKGRKQ